MNSNASSETHFNEWWDIHGDNSSCKELVKKAWEAARRITLIYTRVDDE